MNSDSVHGDNLETIRDLPSAFKLPSYDRSYNSRVVLNFPVTRDPVYALALSIDGKLLAVENDAGRLEIRTTGTSGWEAIKIYKTGGAIRTLLWHPSHQTLFVGCGNGNIYRIQLNLEGNKEEVSFGAVNGFVHVIAFHEGKGQLAVGYENKVVLFDRPFVQTGQLGAKKLLEVPKVHRGSDVRFHPFARGIHYLDQDTILVTFFGKVGILAYSTSTGDVCWGIRLEFSTSMVTSSCLSPSRQILAIANTRTGIDWYSTTTKQFLMTTRYDTEVISKELNFVVGITFVDSLTVAVGNTAGRLIYAQLGMTSLPMELSVGSRTQVIQTLCSGEIDGGATIITVLPVDDQGFHDNRRRPGEIEPTVMVTVIGIRRPPKADTYRAKPQSIEQLPATLPIQVPPDSLGTLLTMMTMKDKYISLAVCVMLLFGAAVALLPHNGKEDAIRNVPITSTITATKTELMTQVQTVVMTSTETKFSRQVETVTSMAIEPTSYRQLTTQTVFITSTQTSQASNSVCICTLTGTLTAPSLDSS